MDSHEKQSRYAHASHETHTLSGSAASRTYANKSEQARLSDEHDEWLDGETSYPGLRTAVKRDKIGDAA